MDSSALLGFDKATHELSKDEEYLKEKSTRRVKEGDQPLRDFPSLHTKDTNGKETGGPGEKVDGNMSYKNKVVGDVGRDDELMSESDKGEEDKEDRSDEGEGIVIEEHQIENYACPTFILSKEEEKRIHRPWRRGVIV
ncbi:hypothetical protein A2U01_0047569, partial [Trifolium medium]|nr:hypothetical protein [Trifolium medium]